MDRRRFIVYKFYCLLYDRLSRGRTSRKGMSSLQPHQTVPISKSPCSCSFFWYATVMEWVVLWQRICMFRSIPESSAPTFKLRQEAYLNGVQHFNNSRMSQGSKLLHSVPCHWQTWFMGRDIEGEYATIWSIVLWVNISLRLWCLVWACLHVSFRCEESRYSHRCRPGRRKYMGREGLWILLMQQQIWKTPYRGKDRMHANPRQKINHNSV